jgi:hypothetical protein
MFRGFLARVMEAAHRLGIHGLTLPTVPEDDGSIIHFFSQLAEQLADCYSKLMWEQPVLVRGDDQPVGNPKRKV